MAANPNRDKENIVAAHVVGRAHTSSTHGQDERIPRSVGANR